ncbi:MAG: DUF1178 family protein [Paracoccaceae bacterium]
MIRYALKCPDGHRFESWFHSAEAFETLRAGAMLSCPDCGATEIAKELMAPAVRPARNSAARGAGEAGNAVPEPSEEAMRKALARLRREVEANSEYVGMNFASEARAIHDGLSPERAIHGEARIDEARKLVEDGVPVAPLPFVPKRKVN